MTLLIKNITFHDDRLSIPQVIQTDKGSDFNTLYRDVNTPESNTLAWCTPKFLCFEDFYLCWHEWRLK